jgi:hypothetical protein
MSGFKAIGGVGIDHDHPPAAALDQLDVVFPEIGEEIHDAGHSLGVRAFPFRGGQHSLDRPRPDDEASRRLLGVIANVASNEPRALLVGGEFAIGDVLRQGADTLEWRLGVGAALVDSAGAGGGANADGPLADFDVFCLTVEATQDTLLRTLEE